MRDEKSESVVTRVVLCEFCCAGRVAYRDYALRLAL
jgi:hypothetical protein